jgi:FixJ family two-component response regulator
MAIKRTIVAIVDDDLAIRKAMANLLSALGYGTELFASGEEFLDAATRSDASCLVVDIQLGDICGVELGRQLAATGFRFPIIFMTASDDGTIRSGAMQLGCVAYLRKPFHGDELIDAIVKATGPVATSDG